MKGLLFFLTLTVLIANCAVLSAQKIRGKVLDFKSSQPLQYVNVGILGKEIGAVTNVNGEFQLNIKNCEPSDTLRASMIGFTPVIIYLSELVINDLNVIRLKEDTVKLEEVLITYKKDNVKELGVKGVSGFMQTGWGYGVTGGERGIKVSSKKRYIIDEINFHVASIGYDSVLLRVHVRPLNRKLIPGDDLIKENIFITVKRNENGWISRDLSNYNISVDSDVVISLELVNKWGKCSISDCFHLSMAVPGGVFLFKEFSFSNWESRKTRSPSMFVKVYFL